MMGAHHAVQSKLRDEGPSGKLITERGGATDEASTPSRR
jgi:hypothetical protein